MQARIVLHLMLDRGPPSVHYRGYLHSLSLPIEVEEATASSGRLRHVEGQGGGVAVNALEEGHMRTSALPLA